MTSKSNLYLNAFDKIIWKNTENIDHLLTNISLIENRISEYLDSIRHDFPYLTDHSLEHSKKLWDYANLIVGQRNNYLNPLEGFILHIAFLIHDAGMCYSILNNKSEIENDPFYTDYINQYPDSSGIDEEALFYTVRQRHGDYAVKIAIEKLADKEYLISDIHLREEFGHIIGKIAKSHTCNISYIDRELSIQYNSPSYPADWYIDCQKLAFILRTADAAHIDNLRTPKTNKMIGEITGESKEHWSFQKKLGFPSLSNDDLIVYSTNSTFTQKEQKAWWFCYDALQVLDRELKSAHEFFTSKSKIGLQAKGVKSINDTLVLGNENIRTSGWNSIDTRVKVSNPIHIASEMGGIKLYGQPYYAIRELIQNSIDAINLFRIHTNQNTCDVGEIKIALTKKGENFIFRITDNGIGMSQTLLTHELLDFGGSYWNSNKFKYDFAGIITKGFKSIGKFGIGFFSIFMLGKKIKVTSWKYGESISEMKTLDFHDGLESNPILRNPTKEEKDLIPERGTSIEILLENNPYDGIIDKHNIRDKSLYNLIKYLVPSCNVKILVNEYNNKNKLEPNAFSNKNFREFVSYIYQPKSEIEHHSDMLIKFLTQINPKLIEVSSGDKVYGKLAILPSLNNNFNELSVVTSKGIRISHLQNFAGYLFSDNVVSIKRDNFSASIPFNVLKAWAVKQLKTIESLGEPFQQLYTLNKHWLTMTFNLYNKSLPILLSKTNNNYTYISISELEKFLKENNSLKIYQEGHSIKSRNPDCPGFIKITYQVNIKNIVEESGDEKITEYDSLFDSILRSIWGNYKVTKDSQISKLGFSLDIPYLNIDTFHKA